MTRDSQIWAIDNLRLNPFWAGRKVAVTGGGGFLGARLTAKLIRQGADVTVAVRNRTGGEILAKCGAKILAGDLRDSGVARALATGAEIVFNLAYDIRGSREDNWRIAQNVIDGCVVAKVRRLVHASSIAVYDDWPGGHLDETSPCDGQGSIYKNTKRAIERDILQRVESGAMDATILQPTIVYGPHSGLWTDLLVERLRLGAIALPDEGRGLCNGIYVDDVADAFVASAARTSGGGKTCIVSGPKPFSWGELIQGYADAAGGRLVHEAAPVARVESVPPSGIRRLIGDPMAIAALPPFRPLLGFARARLGRERLERLRARILETIGKVHEFSYRPAAQDPALFTSSGVCSIARMSAEIGPPQIDLAEGLRLTQAYIRWRYSR